MSRYGLKLINSLWPSDAMWQQRSGPALAQEMPDGTKPLPELILTNHPWGFVEFTRWPFYRVWSRHMSLIWVSELLIWQPGTNDLRTAHSYRMCFVSSKLYHVIIFLYAFAFLMCPLDSVILRDHCHSSNTPNNMTGLIIRVIFYQQKCTTSLTSSELKISMFFI